MGSGSIINCFLTRVADHKLSPTHISLFMAIFYYSDPDLPYKSFGVTRRKLMHFSRIKSFATYHKCLTNLIEWGFIVYQPSYHPKLGSMITIIQQPMY